MNRTRHVVPAYTCRIVDSTICAICLPRYTRLPCREPKWTPRGVEDIRGRNYGDTKTPKNKMGARKKQAVTLSVVCVLGADSQTPGRPVSGLPSSPRHHALYPPAIYLPKQRKGCKTPRNEYIRTNNSGRYVHQPATFSTTTPASAWCTYPLTTPFSSSFCLR